MTCVPRYTLGDHLHIVSEREDGAELEGVVRLRPGRDIELVESAASPSGRRAVVWSWRVVRVTKSAVLFRGSCQWSA
jgi:hypothetical protein